MARYTEIVDGLHLVKLGLGETCQVVIPKSIKVEAQLRPGQYVGIRRLGKILVIVPLTQIDQDGAVTEFGKLFEQAIKAWEKESSK